MHYHKMKDSDTVNKSRHKTRRAHDGKHNLFFNTLSSMAQAPQFPIEVFKAEARMSP